MIFVFWFIYYSSITKVTAVKAGKPARCKAEPALAGGWRGGRSSSGGKEEASRQWMRGEAPPCLRQVKSEFVEFVF